MDAIFENLLVLYEYLISVSNSNHYPGYPVPYFLFCRSMKICIEVFVLNTGSDLVTVLQIQADIT
jgi:hypothetical protein